MCVCVCVHTCVLKVQRVNFRLNFAEIKITLTSYFI